MNDDLTTTPTIRALDDQDRPWLRAQLDERWGGPMQARRGEQLDVSELPGFVAALEGRRVGFACYRIDGAEAELAVIDAGERSDAGLGAALVRAVVDTVRSAGVRSLWVVTTNDNLRALRFYQRYGFELSELRAGAVAQARRHKPSIPVTGHDGIPLRDELELRRLL